VPAIQYDHKIQVPTTSWAHSEATKLAGQVGPSRKIILETIAQQLLLKNSVRQLQKKVPVLQMLMCVHCLLKFVFYLASR